MRSLPVLALLFPLIALAQPLPPPHTELDWYRDAEGTKHSIRTPDDWAVRRKDVLEQFQVVAGKLPSRDVLPALDVRTDEEVTLDDGLVRRKLSYQSSRTHRVAAYLFVPKRDGNQKLPAVLCLHPTGAKGKEIVSLPGFKNRGYALELAQRGFVTFAPDYPTFGDYQIDLTTNADFPSGTIRAVWDNLRAIDLLRSIPEVAGDRIGVIGHSLGGHNAIFTACFDDRIQVIVSSCGFTRFHKYYQGDLKGWTSPRYMPRIASEYQNEPGRVPFDFPELIACLAPRPFFTNSPLHDANFEVSGVKETIAAASGIYRLLGKPENLVAVYPDAGHDFPDEIREQAYDFLSRHLRNDKADQR